MKKTFLCALLLFCFGMLKAQQELLVQKAETGLYLNHTVAAKESLYSIGRAYHLAPKDIAAFNGIEVAGLKAGQVLKIPLNAANFSQTGNAGRPVYYVVGQKEGLYRVSVNSGNVPIDQIKKWNKLSSDGVSTGQKLIIGYLQGGSTESTQVAAEPMAPPARDVETEEEKEKEKEKATPPVVEPKKEAAPPVEQVVKKPEPKPAITTVAVNDGKGGYFKPHFESQTKESTTLKDVTVPCGIFKTISGWQDAKYYALIDGVEPGTIIRVVNPNNGKAVYAKVLGAMSGIRQNQGYEVRISNAAASALEINETDKFFVRLNY